MKLKDLIAMTLCAALFFACGSAEGKAKAKNASEAQQKQAADSSIKSVNSLQEGLAQAKVSKKPLMVDFYADWCGWCKKLDKDVYTNTEVMALSKEFVNVKVDTDKYGKESSQFGVQGLPTIVFLNPDGSVIDRIVGYSPAPEFAASMKKALKK